MFTKQTVKAFSAHNNLRRELVLLYARSICMPLLMEILEMIIIILQITTVLTKRRKEKKYSSSEESSIENLLYYKDCKHKPIEPITEKSEALKLRQELPPEPACPCPKMCCSMCCDCGGPQNFLGRQMQPLQMGMERMMNSNQPPPRPPTMPVQPQIMPKRKKRIRPQLDQSMLQPPIGSRRDFGFTRENIKSLISQDEDIKKILKDLVRVTMKKADLVDMVKARRSADVQTEPANDSVEQE